MDDAAAVRVSDGAADLAHHREQAHAAELLFDLGVAEFQVLEDVAQGAALDALHGEEEAPVAQAAQLVDRGHAGVLELAGHAGLVHEPHPQ